MSYTDVHTHWTVKCACHRTSGQPFSISIDRLRDHGDATARTHTLTGANTISGSATAQASRSGEGRPSEPIRVWAPSGRGAQGAVQHNWARYDSGSCDGDGSQLGPPWRCVADVPLLAMSRLYSLFTRSSRLQHALTLSHHRKLCHDRPTQSANFDSRNPGAACSSPTMSAFVAPLTPPHTHIQP